MRFRRACGPALIAYSACLVAFASGTAAAQYTDPPSTAPNFWLSGGLGTGSAGRSDGLIALVGSAWLSKGILVGGVRKALVTPYEYGDEASDVAVLVGLRTPPSFAAIVGTVGYSSISSRGSYRSTSAFNASSSPTASANGIAFSVQGRVNLSVFGLGVELFGANGGGKNEFTAAAVTVQLGWFEH